jgi:hypothetical protein
LVAGCGGEKQNQSQRPASRLQQLPRVVGALPLEALPEGALELVAITRPWETL